MNASRTEGRFSGSRRARAGATTLLILASFAGAALSGCAAQSTGTKSSWELFREDRQTSRERLAETCALLEGENDWEDVAKSARLLEQKPGKSGFNVIRRDLGYTFAPPFNFSELRDTFRLLN